MQRRAHDLTGAPDGGGWNREPVVWLGLVVFAASLAGCLWMIALSRAQQDETVAAPGPRVMTVPVERAHAGAGSDASR